MELTADQVAQVAAEMLEHLEQQMDQSELLTLVAVAVEQAQAQQAVEYQVVKVDQELLSFDMQSNKGEI
jgi:hypothetical protein